MAKQVLVIGGSYFVGRVFSIMCSREGDMELHLVNRGKAPVNQPGVHEYRCERHDTATMLDALPDIEFDALIDFCAYEPGDIAPVVEALGDRIGHYIFISTASVYANDDQAVHREGDPIILESDDDTVTRYICGKSQLEGELAEACDARGIPYTIVRPAFIYGPFNYAPRESWFIEKIAHGKPIERLVDGTAHFSFVYVVDVARACRMLVGDERAFGETFNLAGPEVVTNESFLAELEQCHGAPLDTVDVTVKQVLERNIAIPWPLDVDELYDGTKFAETFGFAYTPFSEGMPKTYTAFMGVFGSDRP